ncbi:MAG: tetratricopeptide repeat protein [Chthonomonadaceae bacterium]|nr:tetratricopeptide repeat protein [Chthonomonadaceae bacterium]
MKREKNPQLLPTFQKAQQRHAAGRLAEAETLYQQVLAQHPDHEETLFWLAMLYTQQERPLEAVDLFYRALAQNPDESATHVGLGIALRALGQPEEAEACFQRALELAPNTPEIHFHLASAQAAQGRWEEALRHCEQAVALRPDFVEAHHNRSEILRRLGRHAEAEAATRQAQSLQKLAGTLASRRDVTPDAEATRRRLARQATALVERGLRLLQHGQPEKAAQAFQQAIENDPDCISAHVNLALALIELRRYSEAEAAARAAIALDPYNPMAHNNLSAALFMQNRLEEALHHIRRALSLQELPRFYVAQGDLLLNLGDAAGAEASLRRAISLQPDYADAHISLSAVYFLQGDLRRAWPEYAYLRRHPDAVQRSFTRPEWDGRPMPDGTLLLYPTQGFGDQIQFVRYLPMVRDRVGRVILECYPDLFPLFQNVPGADLVVPVRADGRPPELPYDAQAAVMDLPCLFDTALETIPARVPYLHPDEVRRRRWRERLQGIPGIRVGICWAGRPEHQNDVKRSCRLHAFAPLARVPGVTLFSLQKGAAAQQLAEPRDFSVTDLAGELRDFADTAALLAELDLLISVDTAVVHLAGALGRPVWVLLPHFPDWRWMQERADSPWYPTMRLFRQPAPGAWEPLFARVAAALAEKTGDF